MAITGVSRIWRTEWIIVIVETYTSPPNVPSIRLQAICTRLFVHCITKLALPSPIISKTCLFKSCGFLFSQSRSSALPLIKKRITKTADNACEQTVAQAAPCIPNPRTKINNGSSIMFVTAPRKIVVIPTLANPWELINGFIPKATMEKTAPNR